MAEQYPVRNGQDLIHGYCFEVGFYFDSCYMTVGFNRISAVEQSAEYETITEGSGMIHIVPKYISQPKTVVFSKGMASVSGDCISDFFTVGKHIMEVVIKIGRKKYDTRFRQYSLKNCIITKCSISGLDAMKSEVLIEDFAVTYTDMEETFDDDISGIFEV